MIPLSKTVSFGSAKLLSAMKFQSALQCTLGGAASTVLMCARYHASASYLMTCPSWVLLAIVTTLSVLFCMRIFVILQLTICAKIVTLYDKAGLGLGLSLGLGLDSRLGSWSRQVLRSWNNRITIVFSWLDLVLGCNYKTKGEEKKREEKRSERGKKGFI